MTALAYEGEQLTELADYNDPATILEGREQEWSVYRAVSKLPPNLRRVAELRLLDAAEFEAIGAELGCTGSAARMRWQRARDLLRPKLHGLVDA